jgi:sulfur-carrier protein
MQITIKYFASIRESLGTGESVATSAQTLGELRRELIARGGAFADVLGMGKAVRIALNQQMGEESVELIEGAEVAFFPPVTGG